MLTIFFVQLVGLISPGPDFFYVSRQAMANSRRSAILGTIGITLGVGFWLLVVLFGLTFLNQFLPHFQQVLMILGGSYLAFSGIKMAKITQNTPIGETNERQKYRSNWQDILAGLAINLSNPKIIVFFSSVLAGYVSNLSNLWDILAVLVIVMGSALVYFWLIALFFSQPKIRYFYANYNRYLDNFAGIVFILFGGSLIYEGFITLLTS